MPCSFEIWKLQECCKKECSFNFKCGHLCSSLVCGNCFSGRIHKPCIEKCNRSLICGHECTSLCAKECPPCSNMCENYCAHEKCQHSCSSLCVPCKKPCAWRCEHKKCKKLCYEVCDRLPCDLPCLKKLKCNHDCMGYCGEICPPICKICDKDQISEMKNDVRFIYLEDCGHSIEATRLKAWIDNLSIGFKIKLLECPLCKKPIRNNFRYSSYIKRQLLAIDQVKINMQDSPKSITKLKKDILDFVKQTKYRISPFIFLNLEKLIFEKDLSKIELTEIKNKLILYFEMCDIQNKNESFLKDKSKKECLDYEIAKLKSVLLSVLFPKTTDQIFFSLQLQNEILSEIKRVNRILQYFRYKENLTQFGRAYFDCIQLFNRLDFLLINKLLIDDNSEIEVCQLFEKIKIISKPCSSGFYQTNGEVKIELDKVYSFCAEFWYTCHKNHVYFDRISEKPGCLKCIAFPQKVFNFFNNFE